MIIFFQRLKKTSISEQEKKKEKVTSSLESWAPGQELSQSSFSQKRNKFQLTISKGQLFRLTLTSFGLKRRRELKGTSTLLFFLLLFYFSSQLRINRSLSLIRAWWVTCCFFFSFFLSYFQDLHYTLHCILLLKVNQFSWRLITD